MLNCHFLFATSSPRITSITCQATFIYISFFIISSFCTSRSDIISTPEDIYFLINLSLPLSLGVTLYYLKIMLRVYFTFLFSLSRKFLQICYCFLSKIGLAFTPNYTPITRIIHFILFPTLIYITISRIIYTLHSLVVHCAVTFTTLPFTPHYLNAMIGSLYCCFPSTLNLHYICFPALVKKQKYQLTITFSEAVITHT